MKKTLLIFSLFAVVALWSGCATKGYQRADSTSTSLQTASARVDNSIQLVDTVVTDLADLLNNPAPDLKPQFQKFSRDIDALDSFNRDIKSRTQTLQQKEDDYFKKWDEELALIQNEQLRETSTKRKTEVMRQFEAVKASYAKAQNGLDPFIAEVKDIKRVLSVDLTQAGLASLKVPLATAQTDGGIVQKALATLAADFKELGVSLSSRTPQPDAKK